MFSICGNVPTLPRCGEGEVQAASSGSLWRLERSYCFTCSKQVKGRARVKVSELEGSWNEVPPAQP